MAKLKFAEPESVLVINLLGHAQIWSAGENLTRRIKYRKGIALIGYLAANVGIWQSREKLADLLWPELDRSSARNNLRQILNNLATVLNVSPSTSPLKKEGDAVSLASLGSVRVDLALLSDATLARLMSDDASAGMKCLAEIEPRLADLGGEFLAGLALPDAPEFEEWLTASRQHFSIRTSQLLDQVCRAQHREGRLPDAIGTARRLVGLDPVEEERTMALMSLLAEAGDKRGALEAFNILEQNLERNLGVVPGERAVALRDEIAKEGMAVRKATDPIKTGNQPELRWMAAMYCDFGSSAAGGEFENTGFIDRAQDCVQARGGIVVSAAGRGLLAVFGFGESVERPAERALLVAGDMRQAGIAGELRIGIAAGKVLYRATPNAPHLAGEIPDVAMRIGWTAESGEVLVNEAVALRLGDAFRFETLGDWTFRGLDGVHKLFKLPDSASARQQHTVGLPTYGTPFVGRETEIELLQTMWREARSGHARVVVLRGPAGMGKTRLAHELARRVADEGGQVRRIACRLELQHRLLEPVLAAIESHAGISSRNGAGDRREKIVHHLDRYFHGPDRQSLDALVELEGERDAVGGGLTSKAEVFSAIIAMANRLIANGPTLLIIDDLHWADPATREVLRQFTAVLERQQVLVVITTRPEIELQCPAGLTRLLEIGQMSRMESAAVARAYDPNGLLPSAEYERISTECGGIPLFAEHLVKSWLEGEHHHLPIAELLQCELDRLGRDKEPIRAAAVLGSQFDSVLLADLLPEVETKPALRRAIAQGLIESTSAGNFAFRHALIWDAAYSGLPPAKRKAYHERAARLLQASPGHQVEDVARHLQAAQRWQEAADWWVKAGEGAMAREFSTNAMAAFRNALDMLEKLGGQADVRQVRDIQIRLGYAAQVAQGYGSPLAYELFNGVAEALDAAPQTDPRDRETLFTALAGLYMSSSSPGKINGIDLARRLQALAQTEREWLMVSFALGNTLFWLGRFEEAEYWQRKAMTLAADLPPQDRVRYCVDDPAVTCRTFLSWNLWFTGDENAAVAMAAEAVEVARKGKRVHALCFALTFAVGIHWFRGAVAEMVALASESLAIARQYGFPLWEGVDGLFLLCAQAMTGSMADARPLFAAAELMQQSYQAGITTSRWIAVRALAAQGEWGEAEKLLDLTIREADQHEDQYCVADLIWLKGECLAERGDEAAARRQFAAARKLATGQGALGLLARFEAHEALIPTATGSS